MKVVATIGADVMDFVAKRMPLMFGDSIRYAGPYQAIGVLDESNTLVAGVVFNEYQQTFGTIMVHLAADTPRWASRNVIRAILSYPFVQLKCRKVWGATPDHLTRVLRFNHGIGFVREAVLRHHYGEGRHAVITSMLASEYRKFYIDPSGVVALRKHKDKMRPFLEIKEAA